MKDAMTLVSIMQSGKDMQNLISGSLGTDPLLVGDPEKYFNDAMASVQLGAISSVAKSNGPFSDSIFSTLRSNANYSNLNLKEKLDVINSSPIPTLLSNKICKNDSFLTSLAAGDGTLTDEQIAEQKTEIYNYACSEDPNSKEQAARLIALNENNPEILNSADSNDGTIGTGLLLATGRDNPYTKATLAQIETAKKAEEAKQIAIDDWKNGRGIKSLTDCVERAETGPDGEVFDNPDQAPCVKTQVIQSAGTLSDQLSDAYSAPLDTLIASFGTGAGGLIGTAFNAVSIFQGISNSINSLSSGFGGGGGSSGGSGTSPSTLLATYNNPQVIKVNQIPKQNLTSNPEAKEALIETPVKHLDTHLNALSTLVTADQRYISQIVYYQGLINNMKNCFINAGIQYEATTSPRIASAVNYANSITLTNSKLQTTIETELSLIDTTKALIVDTKTRMAASQSSEEISAIFKEYLTKVEDMKLPTLISSATREGDILNFKSEVEATLEEGGALYNYNNDCTSFKAELNYQKNGTGGSGVGGNN